MFMIITRTSYRIGLLGGGTDYPNWVDLHNGCCLSTTINKYCYLMVKKLDDYFGFKYKIVYRKIENVNGLDEIEHSTARECIRYSNVKFGLEVHHSGDLPARSGMGSSSAYAVGLLNALYAMDGKYVDKGQLAKDAIYIEQVALNETVGFQDQISCAFGGFNEIEFLNNGLFSVNPIPICMEREKEFQEHLLLFYLKTNRTASDIASTFVPNIDTKRRQLRISRDLVREGINILCSNSDIRLFGDLLHEYWMLKRSLSDKVSDENIDNYYELAMKNEAIGGKLLGAGGGGFLLLFAEPDKHGKIIEGFKDLLHVPFKFEKTGSTIIFKG